MTYRRIHKKRERRTLAGTTDTKTKLTEKPWFRGLSVLTAFGSSATIIYSLAAIAPAQAISLPSISSMQTTIRSVMQSDALSAALKVTQAQTARQPQDVARFMNEASARNAAITTGATNGYKLVDIQLELQPGIGLTSDMMCAPTAERTTALVRNAASDSNATHKMAITTGQYASTNSAKQAARTRTHLGSYCDISEVNQGLCLPQSDGLGGADSNYTTISSRTRLTPETEAAAYAFMFNVIDPTQTEESVCNTLACESLTSHQRVYQAMASMTHNSFISQINDALIYNPGGENDGKTAAEVLEESAKEQAPIVTTATDGTITTVTKNTNGTITTVIKKPDGTTATKTLDANGKPANATDAVPA